jgi:hypothetical protein
MDATMTPQANTRAGDTQRKPPDFHHHDEVDPAEQSSE